jgi:proline iminopeptidase
MSGALFPPLEPLEHTFLPEAAGHRVYYEVCGAPHGAPALFLHGGPGSSIGAVHRRFFDPARWRIVLFDQRGCGQSQPRGATHANTTGDLVDDIERLRTELRVERWMLFGGSWGSTLALAYAQRHPQRVSGMVLRGVFLATEDELHWFLHGLQRFVPEAWQAFSAGADLNDPLAWYRNEVESGDRARAVAAARRWVAYENALMAIGEAPSGGGTPDEPAVLDRVRVQLHYLAHGCFLPPAGLLEGMSSVQHIPAIIVQGRRDLVCPPVTAHALAARWPRAQLRMVEEGGHSALHPAMSAALVRAAQDLRGMLEEQ